MRKSPLGTMLTLYNARMDPGEEQDVVGESSQVKNTAEVLPQVTQLKRITREANHGN